MVPSSWNSHLEIDRSEPGSGTVRRLSLPGEFILIDSLRRRLVAPSGQSWIGDDVAVAPTTEGSLLLTADAVVAGVHADLSLVGVDDFGWKAMVAAVSDVAAAGGRPRYALVTVAGPLGDIDVDRLFDGLLAAADTCSCAVVGGDLSAGPVLMVSVAVVGEAGAEPPPPVARSGARPGDTLFVTGPLGSAAAGLILLREGRGSEAPDLIRAHARPRARLPEGSAARAAGASAMIDISDGLSLDLGHLADASGVGVVVEHVPVAIGVSRASDDPEGLALGGGEDYELLFSAAEPSLVEAVFADADLGLPVVIGRCTADPTERRLRDDPLPRVGWEHRW